MAGSGGGGSARGPGGCSSPGHAGAVVRSGPSSTAGLGCGRTSQDALGGAEEGCRRTAASRHAAAGNGNRSAYVRRRGAHPGACRGAGVRARSALAVAGSPRPRHPPHRHVIIPAAAMAAGAAAAPGRTSGSRAAASPGRNSGGRGDPPITTNHAGVVRVVAVQACTKGKGGKRHLPYPTRWRLAALAARPLIGPCPGAASALGGQTRPPGSIRGAARHGRGSWGGGWARQARRGAMA